MLTNTSKHLRKRDWLNLVVVVTAIWAHTTQIQQATAQSQLGGVVSAVRTASASSGDSGRDSCYPHNDNDSFWGAVLGDIFGPTIAYSVTAPWWVPYAALGDTITLPAYPAPPSRYWADYSKNIFYEDSFGRGWFGSVWLEYGNDYDNLERTAGAVRLESTSRWGVDTAWATYQEILPAGASDELQFGDFNVTFRFAQNSRIQMRTGIGINWLEDSGNRDIGFNFTYGGDLFLRDHWVLSTEIDWGTLHHAERFHARTTLGYTWKQIEGYGGFDYESFDAASLKSVVFGVRYWF